MAYKFQLGAAVLSGSIKAEDGLVATDVDDTTAANIVAQIDAGEIPIAKLSANTISGVSLGSNLNAFTPATNGGVLFSSYNGSAAVSNLQLDINDLSAATAITGLDSFAIYDLNEDATGKVSVSALGDLLAGAGLANTQGTLRMDVHELSALGGAGIHQTEDFIAFSDNGTTKKISFSNLQDAVFADVSGDATVAAGGALTIAANAVHGSMLNTDSISGQAEMTGDVADGDELMISDGGVLKRADFSVVRDAVYNDVSGDASIAAGGALTIANDAVEQAMIADDAVGADQLASNAVVNASVATGAAIALSKINTNVDMGGAFTIGSQSDDVATFSGGLIVAGDLTVQGSTTTVDSTTINISSSFTFEGPADDHETVLSCATPGADTTLNLPTLSAGTYFIPAIAGAATDASAAVTAAEFALLDGGSSIGTDALVAGDGFFHNDGGVMKHTKIDRLGIYFAGTGMIASPEGVLNVNIDGLDELAAAPHATEDEFMVSDNGAEKRVSMTNVANGAFALVSGDVAIASGGAATIQATAVEGSMLNNNVISGQSDIGADIVATDEILISDAGTIKRTDMSRIKTYIGSGKAAVNAIGDANGTLAVGVNAPSAAASASRTWTLPASADLEVGESIVIKAYGNAGAQPLTIAQAGSQEIDGSSANLVLESDNAAITLYYVAADTFIIV